jgi:hypothetical protein
VWQAIILSFLGGVMGGNAFPHFARGITKKPYPNRLGNGPITNLVAGWAGLVLAALPGSAVVRQSPRRRARGWPPYPG